MKKILSALAFAVATTFASAGPVTITPTGLPSPGSLNLNDWEHSGAVGMTLFAGSTSTAAGVGGLKATFTDAVLGSDSFIAWCVELLTRASPFGTPAVYEQVGASSTPVNVIGKLLECTTDWCRISTDGDKGWIEKTALWGVGPDEVLN